jgi:hypothetical protein
MANDTRYPVQRWRGDSKAGYLYPVEVRSKSKTIDNGRTRTCAPEGI